MSDHFGSASFLETESIDFYGDLYAHSCSNPISESDFLNHIHSEGTGDIICFYIPTYKLNEIATRNERILASTN